VKGIFQDVVYLVLHHDHPTDHVIHFPLFRFQRLI
jgi:hypothetical protein